MEHQSSFPLISLVVWWPLLLDIVSIFILSISISSQWSKQRNLKLIRRKLSGDSLIPVLNFRLFWFFNSLGKISQSVPVHSSSIVMIINADSYTDSGAEPCSMNFRYSATRWGMEGPCPTEWQNSLWVKRAKVESSDVSARIFPMTKLLMLNPA